MKPNLVMLRRFANSTMTCTGLIRVVTGAIFDPNTGATVTTYDDKFSGGLLIYPENNDARVVEVALATTSITRYALLLPHDADVAIGDVLKVTASPDFPALVDLDFRISDAPLDAWAVSRRCVAERGTDG